MFQIRFEGTIQSQLWFYNQNPGSCPTFKYTKKVYFYFSFFAAVNSHHVSTQAGSGWLTQSAALGQPMSERVGERHGPIGK